MKNKKRKSVDKQQKPGPKSKLNPDKKYSKIHPDVTDETKKLINLLMVHKGQHMWEVIEDAVHLLYNFKNHD
jgi:hypothetical protein